MEEKKRTIITQILQQSLHRFQSACLPEGTDPPVSVCWNVWRDEVQYKCNDSSSRLLRGAQGLVISAGRLSHQAVFQT